MKERISDHINDPARLEMMYRTDSKAFESEFESVYNENKGSDLLRFWKVRLDYGKEAQATRKFNARDMVILLVSCLITGFLIRIPAIFSITLEDEFYMKNAALIVFSGLILFTLWLGKVSDLKRLLTVAGILAVLAIYVNLLPYSVDSDSVALVYVHLPFLLWFLYGWIFIGFNQQEKNLRTDFIRYNGDLAILMAVIAISGGILTGVTINLFDAIGIKIEEFYTQNILVVGAVSAPIVATFILKRFNILTNKIAPIIATIFSPLVLLTALAFLSALIISGKNPYSDREFLLIFNLMLFGVMAVIVFSISEASETGAQNFNKKVLLLLSLVTIIIDLIALSAIFYRLGSYGITPNRLAVLGSNIVVLGNIIRILIDLYKVNFRKKELREVEYTVASYLPVYLAWIIFVVVAFPLIFGLN